MGLSVEFWNELTPEQKAYYEGMGMAFRCIKLGKDWPELEANFKKSVGGDILRTDGSGIVKIACQCKEYGGIRLICNPCLVKEYGRHEEHVRLQQELCASLDKGDVIDAVQTTAGLKITGVRRCECGCAKLGLPGHSDWCPVKT